MAKRDSKSKRKVKRRGRPPRQDLFIEFHRVRLFGALGIIDVCRHALASKLITLDEESVMEALRAAYRIINDVAEALEIAIARLPKRKTGGDSAIGDTAPSDLDVPL
jgi:hypothetical protein